MQKLDYLFRRCYTNATGGVWHDRFPRTKKARYLSEEADWLPGYRAGQGDNRHSALRQVQSAEADGTALERYRCSAGADHRDEF